MVVSLPPRPSPIVRCHASSTLPPTASSTSSRVLPPTFRWTSKNGWTVRLINKANPVEIAAVVRLQTEGFHTPSPVPFLDDTFKRFFAAEVLAEMNKKLRYNPEDRFVCLVAEKEGLLQPTPPSSSSLSSIVGVVEVSYIDIKEVLNSLEPGMEGVTYIQSMAVDPMQRRRGVASALLGGAEKVAKEWAEKMAVLHVYQDNESAISLYKKQGFDVIFQDAPWLAKLAVRPRYLMRKDMY